MAGYEEDAEDAVTLDGFGRAVMKLAREIVQADLQTSKAVYMLTLLQDVNAAHSDSKLSLLDMLLSQPNPNEPTGGAHP